MNAAWIIGANCLGWPAVQLSIAWGAGKLPLSRFSKDMPWLRVRAWEAPLYRHRLRLRRWKHRLPDGASWFTGGFTKKTLESSDRDYLARFVAETRRAELAHWLMIACTPLFFIWNPPWACAAIAVYALAANMPCIIVQRYNRMTLLRVLARMSMRDAAGR